MNKKNVYIEDIGMYIAIIGALFIFVISIVWNSNNKDIDLLEKCPETNIDWNTYKLFKNDENIARRDSYIDELEMNNAIIVGEVRHFIDKTCLSIYVKEIDDTILAYIPEKQMVVLDIGDIVAIEGNLDIALSEYIAIGNPVFSLFSSSRLIYWEDLT